MYVHHGIGAGGAEQRLGGVGVATGGKLSGATVCRVALDLFTPALPGCTMITKTSVPPPTSPSLPPSTSEKNVTGSGLEQGLPIGVSACVQVRVLHRTQDVPEKTCQTLPSNLSHPSPKVKSKPSRTQHRFWWTKSM